MAELAEFQFELDGYVFGNGRPIFIDQDGFDPGDTEIITQDQSNPVTGARMMGRDTPGAATWTFAMHVDQEDPDTALAELAALGAIWRNEDVGFRDARVVKMLRYRVGARTRCVFGRPRRFSYKPNNKILGGYLPPLATFDLSDSLHYGDTENMIEIHMAPSVPGGFSWPAVWPLVFERPTDWADPGVVVVGGDAATAPVVTFYGPVTDPKIVVGDFTLGLTGTIYDGGSVTIDARPWAQTISRAGNAGTAALGRTTRLSRALLRPGSYGAVFSGIDMTGSARCRILWRDAWHTL